MEAGIHELSAGYALDALDPAEREEFERHLADCDTCQEDVASFWEVTSALAVAADGPKPPAALRDRILAAARAERPTVVPFEPRRRRLQTSLAAAAAIAAVVAIGLGVYAFSLNQRLDDTRSALSTQEDVAAVLADPNATSVPMAAGTGRLVVAGNGSAVLVLDDLSTVPVREDLPGLGRGGQDARPRGNLRRARWPRRRADPAARAGRRSRGGDDRGRGRREDADPPDPRCFEACVADSKRRLTPA